MEFIYTCRDDNGQQYIEITGVTDASRIIRIPPTLDGKPVRIIGAHAFEKNETIEQIFLPESVRAVGIFAFYGCPNLQMISLTDMAESWGTGAIYFCGKLSEIRLTVMRRRYSILRDMLNDTDKGLYVRITEPEYEAELYFPAYCTFPHSQTVSMRIPMRVNFIHGSKVAVLPTARRSCETV